MIVFINDCAQEALSTRFRRPFDKSFRVVLIRLEESAFSEASWSVLENLEEVSEILQKCPRKFEAKIVQMTLPESHQIKANW